MLQVLIQTGHRPGSHNQKYKLDLQSAGSSPNLTYKKISARDAIKDPLKGLDLDTSFRLDLETYHKFPKVLGLRVEELGTPH